MIDFADLFRDGTVPIPHDKRELVQGAIMAAKQDRAHDDKWKAQQIANLFGVSAATVELMLS